MRMQTELCIELGIPVRVMEPLEVYLTGGRILRELGRRSIEELTPAERRDLRERVERPV